MNTTARICLTICLAFPAIGLSRPETAQQSAYVLERTVRLGGAGGWDYFEVDSTSGRLFIPRGSHMMVTNEEGKVITDIPNLRGAHAVAIASDQNRLFTANDTGHSLTAFKLDSLERIGDIDLSDRTPDGLLYDPFSRHVFAFNGGLDHDASVIDAATGKVVAQIPLGGKPETAQSDEAGKIYVDLQNKDQILVLDAATGAILHTWPSAPCKEPAGLTIDRRSHRLFVGCRNELMTAVDCTTGKVLASVPIGWLVDANRFDPGTALVFASAADGSLTIAHTGPEAPLAVVQTLSTPLWARTIALDARSHKLFAITADVKPGPFPPGAAHPQRQGAAEPGSFKLMIYSPATALQNASNRSRQPKSK